MKNYRNLFFVVLLVCLSAGALMAAGGGEAAKPSGPLTIDFIHCTGGNAQKATLELVDRFNNSQNEVVVEVSYGGIYADAVKQILAAIIAGDPPAVIHLAMSYNAQFMRNGHLEGLNKYIASDPDVKESDFVKGLFDLNRYQGDVYGVPFNCSNPVMYYNKDLFRTAGLDPNKPPVTWDEVYEYSKKLHALGNDVYGFNINRGPSGWLAQVYTWQFGGKWIADDNSTVLWTEAQALDALRFMKSMCDEGVAVYQGASTMNYSGKVGMWIESTASLTNNINAVSFDLGVAVMPYKTKKQVAVGGGSLYISKNIPQAQKDAAWKFLKFMTSKESQLYWAETTGYQAASTAAVDSSKMQELWKQDPRYVATYEQIPYAVAEDTSWLIPFNEVRDIFKAGWDEVILNKGDINKTMAEAQENANKVIAQYK